MWDILNKKAKIRNHRYRKPIKQSKACKNHLLKRPNYTKREKLDMIADILDDDRRKSLIDDGISDGMTIKELRSQLKEAYML